MLSDATSYDVWTTLHNLYVQLSPTCLMTFKKSLAWVNKGTKSMSDYLLHVKQLVTTLNASGANLTMDDVTLHVLNGLPSEYKETSVAIHSQESSLSFDELHEKLCDHETIMTRETS